MEKCVKEIPHPAVKTAQVSPQSEGGENRPANQEKAAGWKAHNKVEPLPPPYQWDSAVYGGGVCHVVNHQGNTNIPEQKSGCCDKKWCVISLLVLLLCVTGVTLAVLLVLYTAGDGGDGTTDVPTTVAPGWGEWSGWSDCDVTCGGGYRSRSRACNGPETACVGPQNQTELCSTHRCPLPEYGTWSGWSSWSVCTKTCSSGIQLRSRVCDQEPEELPCPGDPQQERDCSTWTCPTCSRDCPDGGLGNSPTCDRCLCTSNPDMTGLITDQHNMPLDDVTVVDSHWPMVILDTSDPDGQFTIPDPCNGIELMFVKANYVTTNLVIGSSTTVKMDRVEHLSISGDPVDKQRLVGESVSLCCNVTGKPPPDYVEWFQDGGLVVTLPFDVKGSFIMNNVTTDHAGYYRCRANNDYSSVYSQNAKLSIKDSSNEFCSGNPSPNLITLPAGCGYNGENTLDAGYCAPLPCRRLTNESSTCWMEQQSCCGATEYQILDVDCQSFMLPVKIVKSCGCSMCTQRVINIVGRVMSISDKSPVTFAEVVIDGTVVEQTDLNGDFHISLPTKTRSISITIRDTANKLLVETTKVMHFPEKADGTYYVYIEMMPVRDSSDFDPSNGVGFFLGGKKNPFGAVIIPPGSFYTSSGLPIHDTIEAHLTFMDPRNMTDVQNAPGDLSFVDSEGNRQLLQTYGMFSLAFRSKTTQEKLQLRDKAIFILNSANIGHNNTTPKLWSLNQNTGSWQDEGNMQNDTDLVRKIPARFQNFITTFSDYIIGEDTISVDYTWSNFDGQSERACHSKVRVFPDNNFDKGSELSDFQIEVLVNDNGAYSASDIRAFSDSDTNGYCVVHLCERDPGTADYTALLIGYHGSDPNENRLRPALGDDSGIDSKTMDAIGYNAIDNEYYGAIEYKPRLHAMKNDKGPLYDWDGHDKGIKDWAYSESCSSAKFESDNHFRLYAEDVNDPCSYEYDVLREPNCDLNPPALNILSWYAEAHQGRYRTCFIKVLVENGKDIRFRALSRMGNVTLREENKNLPYGMRDECPKEPTAAICLEVKHASSITNCDRSSEKEDETLVQIGQIEDDKVNSICKRVSVNKNLTLMHRDKFVDFDNDDMFQTYLEFNPYGSNYGIYCEQGSTSIAGVKQTALNKCMQGNNKAYVRKPHEINLNNWAVKFDCSKP